MTDLTSCDLSEKSEIYKMLFLGGLLGSESFIFLCGKCRGLDSAAKSHHFLAVQRFTYDVIGQ